MRLSRHGYDKPHRCPGSSGGGWKYPYGAGCDRGRLRMGSDRYADPWHSLRWHRCDSCDVVTFPIAVHWLDPTWIWWEIKYRFGHLVWDLGLPGSGRRLRPWRFLVYRARVAQIHADYWARALWTWCGPGGRAIRRAEARCRRYGEGS